MDGRPAESHPRRVRLALACTQCRKRKVRCDAMQPKCRNCEVRGDVCETTDLRRPNNSQNVRRLAQENALASPMTPTPSPGSQSTQSGRLRCDDNASLLELVPPPGLGSSDGRKAQTFTSWVSRAYRDCNDQNDVAAQPTAIEAIRDPEVVLNSNESSSKVKYVGASSLQSLAIFADLYLIKYGVQPVSQLFRHAMHHVEEFQLPIAFQLPDLPPGDISEQLVSAFFSRIWPLFPVLDEASFRSSLVHFQSIQDSTTGGLREAVTSTDAPTLACLYAVLSIAADEAGEITERGTSFLAAAHSLYAHLIGLPYMSTAQALFLLAVAQRGRGRGGQAWQALGQAIRVCHSIGLHRLHSSEQQSALGSPSDHGYTAPLPALQTRLWLSCYALEKLMELETGRPSATLDHRPEHAPLTGMPAKSEPRDYFTAWVALARIIGQISENVYQKKETSAVLLCDIGKLDCDLDDWARSVPEQMKPGGEVLSIGEDTEHRHICGFLSMHFYQARIALLRASLMFPGESYVTEVMKRADAVPFTARLLQSPSSCVESARIIARQVLDLADNNITSHIFTQTQAFVAIMVLLLSLLKNPWKRTVSSDLELLLSTAEQIETQYRKKRVAEGFVDGIIKLREQACAVFGRSSSGPRFPTTYPISLAEAAPPSMSMDGGAHRENHSLLTASGQSVLDLTERMSQEEVWRLLGSDILIEDYMFAWPED
ncbi:hypothetical protein GQ53DRAFT_716261 [Thozetella sp. PMI_491]|nr:hypothetical protein GQ53DRAFT_716261 [Thozetella sp. PMI_491]